MKQILFFLIWICVVQQTCAQRWDQRWFRRSNWGWENQWNNDWFDTTWSVPTGGWNTRPLGWSDNWIGPNDWTGNQDSWYSWYSWYSWQGAPAARPSRWSSVGGAPVAGAGALQPTTTSDTNSPTRPAPENGPTGPINSRIRPTNGRRRYRRDIDINDVPIDTQKQRVTIPDTDCPTTFRPVCANNNHTYKNPCELTKARYHDECLDFAYDGVCRYGKEIVCFDCNIEDEHLIRTKDSMQLNGLGDWFAYNMIICGTDGNTYSSMCHLCKTKCLQQKADMQPKYRGHCGAPFRFGGNP